MWRPMILSRLAGILGAIDSPFLLITMKNLYAHSEFITKVTYTGQWVMYTE